MLLQAQWSLCVLRPCDLVISLHVHVTPGEGLRSMRKSSPPQSQKIHFREWKETTQPLVGFPFLTPQLPVHWCCCSSPSNQFASSHVDLYLWCNILFLPSPLSPTTHHPCSDPPETNRSHSRLSRIVPAMFSGCGFSRAKSTRVLVSVCTIPVRHKNHNTLLVSGSDGFRKLGLFFVVVSFVASPCYFFFLLNQRIQSKARLYGRQKKK